MNAALALNNFFLYCSSYLNISNILQISCQILCRTAHNCAKFSACAFSSVKTWRCDVSFFALCAATDSPNAAMSASGRTRSSTNENPFPCLGRREHFHDGGTQALRVRLFWHQVHHLFHLNQGTMLILFANKHLLQEKKNRLDCSVIWCGVRRSEQGGKVWDYWTM